MSIRVEDRFPQFEAQVEVSRRMFLTRVGMIGERKAFEYAPKGKTKGLSNSVGNEVHGDTVQVYANIEYAKYQEGDPYNKRFLGRALDDMVNETKDWKL